MTSFPDVEWWEEKANALRAKADEMLADGATKGLSAVIDAADRAGLAVNRRRRRIEFDAARAAEDEPPPPPEWRRFLDELPREQSWAIQRYMRTALEEVIDAQRDAAQADTDPEPEQATSDADHEAAVLAWVEKLAAWPIARLDAETARMSGEQDALLRGGSRPEADPPRESPVQAPRGPEPARPIETPPTREEAWREVLDDHDHPSWRRLE